MAEKEGFERSQSPLFKAKIDSGATLVRLYLFAIVFHTFGLCPDFHGRELLCCESGHRDTVLRLRLRKIFAPRLGLIICDPHVLSDSVPLVCAIIEGVQNIVVSGIAVSFRIPCSGGGWPHVEDIRYDLYLIHLAITRHRSACLVYKFIRTIFKAKEGIT